MLMLTCKQPILIHFQCVSIYRKVLEILHYGRLELMVTIVEYCTRCPGRRIVAIDVASCLNSLCFVFYK